MLVAAKIFHPTYEIVKELTSLRYIRASQTVLLGKFSTENASLAVRKASCGIQANNDPSEANFGCFSEAFKYCRGMDITSTAGLGMTRGNNDFGRGSMDMVSGKWSTAGRESEESTLQEIGLFHELGIKLTNSLIATAKHNSSNFWHTIINALRLQAQAREEKLKAIWTNKWTRHGRC